MIYLVAWTGGYEPPQYAVCATMTEASEVAEGWLLDADTETDTIAICEIDGTRPSGGSLTIKTAEVIL